MIVYHYLNRQFGIESLLLRRLRASVVHKLRDPFEHRAFAMDGQTAKGYDAIVRQLEEAGIGIICFSADFKSPVMWSQYADNHTGLCLGFELPGVEHQSVRYVSDREPRLTLPELTVENLIVTAMTKFDGWRYEEEYRARVRLDPSTKEGDNYFVNYCDQLVLKQVVAGMNCSLPIESVERLVEGLGGVEIFQVRPSGDRFQMTRTDASLGYPV